MEGLLDMLSEMEEDYQLQAGVWRRRGAQVVWVNKSNDGSWQKVNKEEPEAWKNNKNIVKQ